MLRKSNVGLHAVKATVSEELEVFEAYFKAAITTPIPLLTWIIKYLLRRKGKQIRPLLVLLSARLCGGITPASYRAAALIELLHTATLIHDDVVDNAPWRRGFFSIPALWKNKIAVLVGDFLLAKGLLLALEHKDYLLLELTSDAVREMSEGELLQLQKARTYNIDEALYFDIIRRKTASLMAACCACGAASAQENEDIIQIMKTFGYKIGIAFQIKDDLLDFSHDNTGKLKGIDLLEGKITLPLIHTINRCSRKERKRLLNLIRSVKKNKKHLNTILEAIQRYQGIAYAEEQMQKYAQEAITLLKMHFPDSETREALIQLVHFIIQRRK